jgi:NAD(P)-dependent dehydrogenase (short-subunit alcohol dehydrogenase family)
MSGAAARTALVVGGTNGIGRAIALRLAEEDFRVFVVGRDAARGADVVAECGARGSRLSGHAFLQCDASRLSAVRACAAEVASRAPALDALFLTQGIASIAGRTETSEGLDVKLSLHYFSRVAFIRALLPQLRLAPNGAAVLCVLSAGVHGPYTHYADDFELKTHYGLKNAADAAGFYTDAALHSLGLEEAAHGSRVTFAHAAPGIVATAWGTELPWAARMLVRGLQTFAPPPQRCADIMVRAALRPRDAAEPPFRLVSPDGGEAKTAKLHDAAGETIWRNTLAVLDRIK